jgi:hypothetical protein
MPKVFIIAPFTEKASVSGDGYGPIKDMSFRNFLETIEATIRECGLETNFLYRNPYQWGEKKLIPQQVVQSVYDGVQVCDVLVAYPERSSGVNMVIGWASMLKKKVVILLNERDRVSIAYAGLDAITDKAIVKFRDISDLKIKLKDTLNKIIPHH